MASSEPALPQSPSSSIRVYCAASIPAIISGGKGKDPQSPNRLFACNCCFSAGGELLGYGSPTSWSAISFNVAPMSPRRDDSLP
ncbi:hypothetical protein E2P81_ATG06132 [Venturia nashicola]|uniref:Uncharacterized protein n=1 Tax=Venturia nashicola TaxID=86259 RepID=A0A4Z1PC38_9PEZI|nr:hypothetical protein E6O75_ATG06272 [Venturia nashicola]TLD29838.1 hypothetical protein E2P81_ATG06132 [Venturia nashicola]